jgi:hypothetical protein
VTQVLYAARTAGNPVSDLYTVDPVTGAGTLVGPYTGAAVSGFANAHDICFDASGQLYAVSSFNGDIWQIDKATAAVIKLCNGDNFGGGCDFDSSGTFWHVGNDGFHAQIVTFNLSSCVYTIIAPDLSDSNYYHSGSFDQFDVFWASGPGGSGSGSANLVTIAKATGVVTVIGAFSVPGVGGLTWGPSAGPGAPFTLAASPNSFSENVGGSAVFHSTITSTLVSGSPENITLSVDSSPITGVTTGIVPSVITDDGGIATLTITLDGTTPLGTYTISIKGDDGLGGVAHTSVALHITTPAPGFHIAS